MREYFIRSDTMTPDVNTEVEYLHYISGQLDAILTFLTIFFLYGLWKALASFIDKWFLDF